MIISLRLKNFFSLRDDAVLDFTADMSSRRERDSLPENLIDFKGDKFVNILGLFGANASGKSNIIKGIDFCRTLVLTSHLNNLGDRFDFEPFKFDKGQPSEFYINFVTEGIEYEYSFSIQDNRILSEELYYYPNKRKARIFQRKESSLYTYGKGAIARPTEIEANTGPQTLFISRASSMNRPTAQIIYRFFMEGMTTNFENTDLSLLSPSDFEGNKAMLLKALEVSDSDIVDISLTKTKTGIPMLQSFHRENPSIPFDFIKEESEGTIRLIGLLLLLLRNQAESSTVFMDEFDLKLHLHLAEFILDMVRASRGRQLVFTSHNPALIDSRKLRNEQIVFVTKTSDGNSEFVPLSDYEGISKIGDLQKAYLQGRFDAIPYIGNIHSVTSEPQ